MPSPDYWLEIAKQVPSLGVLVSLVVMFLRYIERSQAKTDILIAKNSEMLGAVAEALRK